MPPLPIISMRLTKEILPSKPFPGLYALNIATGKMVWKTPRLHGGCLPILLHPPSFPGSYLQEPSMVIFVPMLLSDGKILWDFDTAADMKQPTASKVKADPLMARLPVIADGMLFVNSGYGMFGEMPGNVLLAFEVDKKIRSFFIHCRTAAGTHIQPMTVEKERLKNAHGKNGDLI